jgi:hypothetical protein
VVPDVRKRKPVLQEFSMSVDTAGTSCYTKGGPMKQMKAANNLHNKNQQFQ